MKRMNPFFQRFSVLMLGLFFAIGCFHDKSSDLTRDTKDRIRISVATLQPTVSVAYRNCESENITKDFAWNSDEFAKGYQLHWDSRCEKSFLYKISNLSTAYPPTQKFVVKFYDSSGHFLISGTITPVTLGSASWEMVPYLKAYPKETIISAYIFSEDELGSWYARLMFLDFIMI